MAEEMPSTGSSLATRALVSLALMIGFYVLAVAVAGGLLYIPYWEWTSTERIHPKLAICCVALAGIILWSILPRWDRFDPPGPRLDPELQPRLFAFLRDVAAKTGQQMPSEVYLVPEVNAFVAQRGGIMGIGSRRVMGLGLPVMQVLTLSRFRAVIAHEFGHYAGGDTALGPLIYRARASIGRTLDNLGDSVISLPFRLYGAFYMRVTQAISREQERAADELASRLAGSSALIDGLKAVHAADHAFNAYWQGDVLPVLDRGFRPKLAEGFLKFSAHPSISELIVNDLKAAESLWEVDTYDSHPALAERLALASRWPDQPRPADDPAASTLLDGLDKLEEGLIASIAPPDIPALAPVAWDEVGPKVFVPAWKTMVQSYAGVLQGMTVSEVASRCAQLDDLAAKLAGDPSLKDAPEPDAEMSDEDKEAYRAELAKMDMDYRRRTAVGLLGAAVANALLREGWTLDPLPGPAVFRKDGMSFQPFSLVEELAAKELGSDDWARQAKAAGIDALSLVAVTRRAA